MNRLNKTLHHRTFDQLNELNDSKKEKSASISSVKTSKAWFLTSKDTNSIR